MTEPKLSIEEAAKALREAQNRCRDATDVADAARRKEIDARNALNAAQKAFDLAVGEMRRNPDRQSHWACEQRRKEQGDD